MWQSRLKFREQLLGWSVLFLIPGSPLVLANPDWSKGAIEESTSVAQAIANESRARGNLRGLADGVEWYRGVHKSYPDTWEADMYSKAGREYGPSEFAFDIQFTARTVAGYDYRYTPLPEGCVEPNCSGFTLTAVPHRAGEIKETGKKVRMKNAAGQEIWWVEEKLVPPDATGTYSFFIDQSMSMRHCLGGTGAKVNDPLINELVRPCQR